MTMRDLPMHVLEGAATPWRPWFAWCPTRLSEEVRDGYFRLSGDWTWLRWIERRRFYAGPWFVIWGWDEFRRPTHEQEPQP